MTEPDERDLELDWTRRQLDEVAAENIRLTTRATKAMREVDVRRRGFTLLSQLGRTLGRHVELKPAVAAALPVVAEGLNVERVVALERDGDEYVPFAWTGVAGAQLDRIVQARLTLPTDHLTMGVLVTRETPEAEWMPAVREAMGVPVFVAVAVGDTDIVLLAGRVAQLGTFYLRLERADIDTLAAAGELVAAAVQNTQVAALTEVKRFLPPSVADELMSGRLLADQGHERRDITLLAADMVGFTRLADTVDPERLAELLNRYLGEMTTLAHAHGGTVGSLAGDGVLVMFGAPEACPPAEHAWAAAQAAFAMRARLSHVADDEGTPVSVRIGLNTGSCAVGVFGSASQATYTAIGLPVNLAARLESAAAPGMILASERTAQLLAHRVQCVPRGRLELKGFSAPVPALMVEPVVA